MNKDKQILFVCTGNWFRSKFAETYLRSKGYTNVISRGIDVNNNKYKEIRKLQKINKCVKKKLKQLKLIKFYNYNIVPTQLSNSDIKRSRITIAMDKKEHRKAIKSTFSKYSNNVIYWDISDVDAGDCTKEDTILTKLMIKIDSYFA